MASMSELEQGRKGAETILKWMERLQGVHDVFLEAKAALGERESLAAAIAVHRDELAGLHQEWSSLEAAVAPLRAELAALPERLATEREARWDEMSGALAVAARDEEERLQSATIAARQQLAELTRVREDLQAECAQLQTQVLSFRNAMDAARDQAVALIGA